MALNGRTGPPQRPPGPGSHARPPPACYPEVVPRPAPGYPGSGLARPGPPSAMSAPRLEAERAAIFADLAQTGAA